MFIYFSLWNINIWIFLFNNLCTTSYLFICSILTSLFQLFSLRAKSNRHFIHVENKEDEQLKANSDVAYERTAFEAVVYPGSVARDDMFIISLRSLSNGKLLSAKDERLFANAKSLSESEKFYVYYSFNNVIGSCNFLSTFNWISKWLVIFFHEGLKSKASGSFLSAHPSTSRRLKIDRRHFKEWEMFEIVSYS